jgi:hypothetical protein
MEFSIKNALLKEKCNRLYSTYHIPAMAVKGNCHSYFIPSSVDVMYVAVGVEYWEQSHVPTMNYEQFNFHHIVSS